VPVLYFVVCECEDTKQAQVFTMTDQMQATRFGAFTCCKIVAHHLELLLLSQLTVTLLTTNNSKNFYQYFE